MLDKMSKKVLVKLASSSNTDPLFAELKKDDRFNVGKIVLKVDQKNCQTAVGLDL